MPFSFKILRVALLILYLEEKGNGIWQFTVVRRRKRRKDGERGNTGLLREED